MHTWTDTTYELPPDKTPFVTTHTKSVSLHYPGYMLDGHGFVIHFAVEHLPVIAQLFKALAALENHEPPTQGPQ